MAYVPGVILKGADFAIVFHQKLTDVKFTDIEKENSLETIYASNELNTKTI